MDTSASHFRWRVAVCALAVVLVPASASGKVLDEVAELIASDGAAGMSSASPSP